MFKNIIVYRIAAGWQADLTQLEEALAKAPVTRLELDDCGHSPHRDQEAACIAVAADFARRLA